MLAPCTHTVSLRQPPCMCLRPPAAAAAAPAANRSSSSRTSQCTRHRASSCRITSTTTSRPRSLLPPPPPLNAAASKRPPLTHPTLRAAAAAAASNNPQHTASSGCSTAQPPTAAAPKQDHAHALSVVLLMNENIRRQADRPLLSRDQLLRGVELVEGADYAALVISSSSSDSNGAQASACTVLYANQAARDVFSLQQQPPQQLHQLTGLPAAVADMLHSLHSQQVPSAAAGHSSQQQQQHFSVLHNVDWPCSGAANSQQQQQQLCIPQLLCVPLVSPNDAPFGLALLFDAWQWGDGALGVPGYTRVMLQEIPGTTTATEVDGAGGSSDGGSSGGDGGSGGSSGSGASSSCVQLQAAADAVRQQADAVRLLKTQQGLSNKDPAVVAAVSQLQALKQQLSRLEGLQQAFAPDRTRPLQEVVHALLSKQQHKQPH